MKSIALLGCTGSIGLQTLDLIRSAPEAYSLHSIASTGRNPEALLKIIQEFKPRLVSVQSESAAKELKSLLQTRCEILFGPRGLKEVVCPSEVSDVIVAVVGAVGLEPTLAALSKGKRTIVANKETLVSAGHLIRQVLHEHGGSLIPADSEHVALHQCLADRPLSEVRKICLTASGGPFYASNHDLSKVTVQQALQHPTWKMGAKITIDSATLMNKGLEVIEAERLFGLDYDRIQVLIHPESLLHSLVEFIDGNILAQLGPNDMRLALQYALDWPERKPNLSGKFLDLVQAGKLHFYEPDFKRFRCLQLAYEAGRQAKTFPAVLVAADEIAVELFLKGQISFDRIPNIIEETLSSHKGQEIKNLEDVLEADRWARQFASQLCSFV